MKIESNKLEFITTFKYPTKNCIFNVYKLTFDKIDINNIVLQENEVESIEIMQENDIIKINGRWKIFGITWLYFSKISIIIKLTKKLLGG